MSGAASCPAPLQIRSASSPTVSIAGSAGPASITPSPATTAPWAAEPRPEPPGRADCAKDGGHARDGPRIAATAVRRGGGLVAVEQGDAPRPEPAGQSGERAADPAAPAGDENAAAAEQLLQLEH